MDALDDGDGDAPPRMKFSKSRLDTGFGSDSITVGPVAWNPDAWLDTEYVEVAL